jgi:transposase-like protein
MVTTCKYLKRRTNNMDPKLIKKEVVDRYIQTGGNFCPFCESANIEGCGRDSDDGYTTQLIVCNDCHAQWQDFYELTAILDISGDRIEGVQ